MAPSTGERGRRGRLNSTIKAICFLSRLSGSGIVLWPVCGGKFESGGARGMPGRVPISGGWMGRDDDDGGRSKKAAYIRISPLAKSSREIGGLFFFREDNGGWRDRSMDPPVSLLPTIPVCAVTFVRWKPRRISRSVELEERQKALAQAPHTIS